MILQKPKRLFPSRLIIFFLAAALIGFGFAGFYYYRFMQLQKNVAAGSRLTVSDVVSAVSKLIVLPADEEPTLATVADLKPLSSQPFFDRAQVGDEVLIYTQSQKAILYRPSENKIIEIGSISMIAPSGGKN
jgi:hypothetical protein